MNRNPKSRRSCFAVLGAVFAGAVFSPGSYAGVAPEAPLVFQSANGYSITPPTEMHLVKAAKPDEDKGSDVDFLEMQEDDDNGTRLSIMVQPDPAPVTLEQTVRIMRSTVEDGMKEEKYKILKQDTLVLDGSKALTLTASLEGDHDDDPKTPAISYRNVLIFTVHGGKLYVLNYASPTARYAQTKKTLDASLASLRWTK